MSLKETFVHLTRFSFFLLFAIFDDVNGYYLHSELDTSQDNANLEICEPFDVNKIKPNSSCSLFVQWEKPRDPSVANFSVYWQEVNETDILSDTVSRTDDSYTIEDLLASTNYEIWVSYSTQIQECNSTGSTKGKTLEGDPPNIRNLIVKDELTSSTRIFLEWETSEMTCPIQSYIIEWKADVLWDDKRIIGVDSCQEKEYVMTNLIPYSKYKIAVVAVTTDNMTGDRATTSAKTLQGEPGPPFKFHAYPLSSTRMKLNWTEPADMNGIFDNYLVQYSLPSEIDVKKSLETKLTSVMIDNLIGCTFYDFTVQASTGKGGYGTPAETEGQTSTDNGPPAVSRFDDDVGPDFAILLWSPPNTNCTIVTYTIQGNGTVLWEDQNVTIGSIMVPGNETSYTVEELVPFTNYNFSIFATTEGGDGHSATHSLTTEEDVPSEPLNLEEQVKSPSKVILRWDPPQQLNGFVTYSVKCYREGQLEISDITNETKYTIDNLLACIRYKAKVAGNTSAGVGPWTETSFVMDSQEPPPTIIEKCIVKDANIVEVQWIRTNTTCPVQSYHLLADGEILWTENGTKTSTEFSISECCTFVFDNLVPYTEYEISLYAKTKGGIGPVGPSSSCNVTTKEDVPGRPKDLKVNDVTQHSFKITWMAPEKRNGILKGFNVKLNDYQASYVDVEENSSYVYTLAFDHLEKYYLYRIGVNAETNAGAGLDATITANTKSNTILILGITIPAVIIVVAFLVFKYQGGCMSFKRSLGRTYPVPSNEEQSGTSTTVIPFDHLRTLINKLQSGDALNSEFGRLTVATTHRRSVREAEKAQNHHKNRYSNILPYDDTRVPLRHGSSSYINASYVNSLNHSKFFIATQGPQVNTLEDFWNMIWHENVDIIVMLTKCFEHGKDKCCQYWPRPLEIGTDLGDFSIHNINEEATPLFSVRILEVTNRRNNGKKLVRQYHYTAWPDFGAPYRNDELLRLIHTIKRNITTTRNTNKMIVHCSAGVGRTGTFIGLWNIIERIDGGAEAISIFQEVMNMRKQRMMMVQTQDQYLYLHKCVAEYFDNRAKWQVLPQGTRPTDMKVDQKDPPKTTASTSATVYDNLSFQLNEEFEGNLI